MHIPDTQQTTNKPSYEVHAVYSKNNNKVQKHLSCVASNSQAPACKVSEFQTHNHVSHHVEVKGLAWGAVHQVEQS